MTKEEIELYNIQEECDKCCNALHLRPIKLLSIKELNIKQGNEHELRIKPIIEKKFNVKLKKTHNLHPFDYIDSNNYYYEIKSRNCTSSKYPSSMIGKNKIDYANRYDKNFMFIFSFTDGDFYYIYNRSDDNSDLIFGKGGRKDRGKAEIKDYCFIPINKLTNL